MSEKLFSDYWHKPKETSRDTTTGIKYEKQIEKLLEEKSIPYKPQYNVGKTRSGKGHRVDILLNGKELISLKHQEVGGTNDEKIVFECMKLQHAIEDYDYESATIVLEGPAWKAKNVSWGRYFLSNDFKNDVLNKLAPNVRVIDHETFLKEYIDA